MNDNASALLEMNEKFSTRSEMNMQVIPEHDTVFVNPVSHNIVWIYHLEPEQETRVNYVYSVQHPAEQQIELN